MAMPERARRVLYWAPRALGVFLAVFSAVFALDVQALGLVPGGSPAALAVHLLPTALFAGALAVAWRWELVGAQLFLGLALVCGAVAGLDEGMVFGVLVGPAVLEGAFFLAAWQSAQRGRAA